MFYTVYKITNKINGKFYIGKHQTKNLDDGYMGSGKLIKRAIKKYGIENFIKEILFVFNNEEEMNTKEKELVILNEDSYNLCPGGKGGFGYINDNNLNIGGIVHKERIINDDGYRNKVIEWSKRGGQITAEKILNDKDFAKKRIDKIISKNKQYLEKYGSVWNGKKHLQETKNKIGEKNKINALGEKNSQYGTLWITNGSISKKIKKVDIIPEGWYKGRVINL